MLQPILLAAGSATRFGRDKLLAPLPNGTPVALAAIDNLLAVLPRVTVVVATHDAPLAAQLRRRSDVSVVVCPDAQLGLGHSLACGVRSSPDADGWLIALADMPFVSAADIRKVVATFEAGAPIAVPVFAARRGHPVAFAAQFREELLSCEGDRGGARLLVRHAALVTEVACAAAGVITDIDTPADLRSTPR